MAVMHVTSFFAPASPKRPVNFIVIKYFLLGLLISNSIESILIIPKILDVLDQTRIQVKELETINIKKEELRELVSEKEREQKELMKEEFREVKKVVQKTKQVLEEIDKEIKDEKEEEFEENEEKEHQEGKNHHSRKGNNHEEDMEEEEEEEEEEKKEHAGGHHDKSKKPGEHKKHITVRKRPQRKETGANYVAVFMLFYGSVTLCLGLCAIFRESALLLAGLIGVSIVGILILISAGFSLIMIMSCSKDIVITVLTYKFRDMIVTSDSPLPTAANVAAAAGADVMYDPNVIQMPQQVSYS